MNSLVQAQSARFERMDRMLPSAAAPPDGEVLGVALPDGDRIAGTLVRTSLQPGSAPTLWSAAQVWELYPLLGDAGGEAMELLLRDWHRVLSRISPAADSAAVLTWPSRDVEPSRALLDHGLVPLSSLAVRRAPDGEPDGEAADGVSIRLAGARDLDTVVELELAELAYSATVGASVLRPHAARIKRTMVAAELNQGDPVWLAERDGVPVGLAHCRVVDVATGSPMAVRLRAGRWGYVNSVSVVAEARGSGIARRLMTVAHRELRRHGATGTFLYYNPPNPLASVFWARQGYRPLWTTWEVRPAGALR